MSVPRVVLVRHGQSEWNAEGRWQGHSGSGLTAQGVAQAEASAGHLAARFSDVDALVRSDLGRVVETAAPIAAALGLEERVDVRWREIDVGSWAGRTHAEVAEHDREGYQAWLRGEDPRRGGGERDADLRLRVASALQELAGEATGTVIVVTHGGPVRVAAAEALGLPGGGHRRLGGPANCGLTTIVADHGDLRLASYNEIGHLARVSVTAPAAG